MAIPAIGLATASATAAAASTALSVAAVVQSQVQASVTAKAQEEAAQKRNDQLVEQTIANYDQLADAELDAAELELDQNIEIQKSALKEKGRINVMSAALGTSGMSVKSQLDDLEREKYSNINTVLLDRQAKQDNIRSQAENLRFQAANGMEISPVSRPSYAAAALSVGAVATNGYTSYKNQEKQSDLLSAANTINDNSVKSGG